MFVFRLLNNIFLRFISNVADTKACCYRPVCTDPLQVKIGSPVATVFITCQAIMINKVGVTDMRFYEWKKGQPTDVHQQQPRFNSIFFFFFCTINDSILPFASGTEIPVPF